mgnify:CR=1 FL=1
MSISRVFLDIEDVVEVELERKDGKLVIWYWHGADRAIGHFALHGQPEVFVKDAEGRRDIEDAEIEIEVEDDDGTPRVGNAPSAGTRRRRRVSETRVASFDSRGTHRDRLGASFGDAEA